MTSDPRKLSEGDRLRAYYDAINAYIAMYGAGGGDDDGREEFSKSQEAFHGLGNGVSDTCLGYFQRLGAVYAKVGKVDESCGRNAGDTFVFVGGVAFVGSGKADRHGGLFHRHHRADFYHHGSLLKKKSDVVFCRCGACSCAFRD